MVTKEASTNYVPEVSVIRRRLALSGFIGCKELRRRLDKSHFKYQGSTLEMGAILSRLRFDQGAGTFGVAVKCVDIERNTKGEGKHLGHF